MADAGRADHDRHEWEVFENLSQNGVAKCVHHYDVFKNTPTGVDDLYGAFKAAIEFVDINGDGKHDAIVGGA